MKKKAKARLRKKLVAVIEALEIATSALTKLPAFLQEMSEDLKKKPKKKKAKKKKE